MRFPSWRSGGRLLAVTLLALGLGALGMVAANVVFVRHAESNLDRLVVKPAFASPIGQLPAEWRAAQSGVVALARGPSSPVAGESPPVVPPRGASVIDVGIAPNEPRPLSSTPPTVPQPNPPAAGHGPGTASPPGPLSIRDGEGVAAAEGEALGAQVAAPSRPAAAQVLEPKAEGAPRAQWVDWATLSRTLGVLPGATHVSIPAIGLDAPMVDVAIVWDGDQRAWQRAKDSVGHHAGTANPGELGNMVFSGHVSSPVRGEGSIFKDLPLIPERLDGGEVIEVYVSTPRQTYIYRLLKSDVVAPDDLTVFAPTEEPSITLITCVPDLVYSHRLVITGYLVKVMQGGAPSRGQTVHGIVVQPAGS